jgi:hypothetical protein
VAGICQFGQHQLILPCKKRNGCCILLALVPVPREYTFKGKGSTAALKLQQEYDRDMQRRVYEMIFKPLEDVAENGKFMHCADRQIQKCIPVVNA